MADKNPKPEKAAFRYLSHKEFSGLSQDEKVEYLERAAEALAQCKPPPAGK